MKSSLPGQKSEERWDINKIATTEIDVQTAKQQKRSGCDRRGIIFVDTRRCRKEYGSIMYSSCTILAVEAMKESRWSRGGSRLPCDDQGVLQRLVLPEPYWLAEEY